MTLIGVAHFMFDNRLDGICTASAPNNDLPQMTFRRHGLKIDSGGIKHNSFQHF